VPAPGPRPPGPGRGPPERPPGAPGRGPAGRGGMLPGDAPPGRGAPGLGAPGRGACGRGIGRSTGCADENGLLPTRGVRAAGLGAPGTGPGRGPGVAPGVGAGRAGAAGGAAGAGAAGGGVAATAGAGAGAGAGSTGAAGLGACGRSGTGRVGAAGLAGEPLPSLLTFCAAAGFAPPNDSRNLRATGASTVEDADLTNSPCSLSRASTSLLVTPSSLANSCTRALPATTSPSLEASAVVGAAPWVSYDTWSSGLHGVLIFLATCSVSGWVETSSAADSAKVL